MGARGCLGMELDSTDILGSVTDTGNSTIVEMTVSDL
jgi:hypothetical protein